MNWIIRKGIDFIILLAVTIIVGIFVLHIPAERVGTVGLMMLIWYIIIRRKRFTCKKK